MPLRLNLFLRARHLKCDVDGKPTMVVGLNQGMLLFNLAKRRRTKYIKNDFFDEPQTNRCLQRFAGPYIVFTSKREGVFSLNIGIRPFTRYDTVPPKKTSFSAPVSLNGLVYFEALSDSGKRSLARFNPISGQLSKVKDLDNEPETEFRCIALPFLPTPTSY